MVPVPLPPTRSTPTGRVCQNTSSSMGTRLLGSARSTTRTSAKARRSGSRRRRGQSLTTMRLASRSVQSTTEAATRSATLCAAMSLSLRPSVLIPPCVPTAQDYPFKLPGGGKKILGAFANETGSDDGQKPAIRCGVLSLAIAIACCMFQCGSFRLTAASASAPPEQTYRTG